MAIEDAIKAWRIPHDIFIHLGQTDDLNRLPNRYIVHDVDADDINRAIENVISKLGNSLYILTNDTGAIICREITIDLWDEPCKIIAPYVVYQGTLLNWHIHASNIRSRAHANRASYPAIRICWDDRRQLPEDLEDKGWIFSYIWTSVEEYYK